MSRALRLATIAALSAAVTVTARAGAGPHSSEARPAGGTLDYFVRLCLEVTDAEDAGDPARLTLAVREAGQLAPSSAPFRITGGRLNAGKSLLVEFRPGEMALIAQTGGASEALWRGRVPLSPGTHRFLMKVRPDRVLAYLDRRLVVERPFSPGGRPRVRFEASRAVRPVQRPALQPAESILFTDDFARTAGEGVGWDVVSGRFSLSASHVPENAQSAFRLVGRSPDRGIALAGGSYWFWDDYRIDVSAKTGGLPAAWGVVFYCAGPADWHAFVWRRTAAGPGAVELIRHRDGQEEVLASAERHMRPDQWYRATVLVSGTSVKAYVCGERVLDADDPTLVCGRAGLLVGGASTVYFDDVVVRSVGPEVRDPGFRLPTPLGPAEASWGDLSGKAFSRDAHMRHWAHPRSFWTPVSLRPPSLKLRGAKPSVALAKEGGGGRCRFSSRVFHDVTFRWSARGEERTHWPRPLEIQLFGQPRRPRTGYRFVIAPGAATIWRGERRIARTPLQGTAIRALECRASPGEVTMSVNDHVRLTAKDAAPLRDGHVCADLGPLSVEGSTSPDWRDGASVLSTHRLDYTFDAAPTAWHIQSGVWRATHRWACVPKWSFYGGRGLRSSTGADPGCAILWNRRRFKGDFDLHLFFAPMEASPQAMHFSWPITLNVAFAADGRRLDSGYALVFGTTDVPTRLFREGRPVASFDGFVEPGLRREATPFYQRTSRTWQHVRVQRRGETVEIGAARFGGRGEYLGLEPVISYADPRPPAGDRVGLWTWGANGMAVARATISFAESPGLASPPGLLAAPVGMKGASGTTTVAAGDDAGRRLVRVTNAVPGGHFEHELVSGPIDLEKTGTVEFDCRTDGAQALSLFARVRGQTGQAVLWGPGRVRSTAIPLGKFVTEARVPGGGGRAGAWRHVRIDLRGAFRSAFPKGPLIAPALVIASPFETVEQIAGFGVNAVGSGYELADVRVLPSAPRPPPENDAPPRILVDGHAPLDDFERGLGGWERFGGRDGAALYRDPRRPGAGRYSLRLANEVLGGPAGAWICREAYDLDRFPVVSFKYRWPSHAELNLLVRLGRRWYEVQLTGLDRTWRGGRPWPIVARIDGFDADDEWHETSVDLQAALQSRTGQKGGTIRGMVIADTYYMCNRQGMVCWIDDFCRVPAVDPERGAEFVFEGASGGKPTAYSHVFDDDSSTEPLPRPTGEGDRLVLRGAPGVRLAHDGRVLSSSKGAPGGRFLHVRVRDAAGRWSRAAHLPLVVRRVPEPQAPSRDERGVPPSGPPPAPYVSYVPSDRLCRTDFEWSRSRGWPEAQMGEFAIRRQAWLLRSTQGATGDGAVMIVNINPRDFFSAYFRQTPYDPARWPRVSFDYQFLKTGCALNLSAVVNGTMAVVEWTGRNPPKSHFAPWIVGRADRAMQDRDWHHVDFNLHEMIRSGLYRARGRHLPLSVSELATWATSHGSRGGYRNPAQARLKVDNLCIFSPRGRDPAFEWKLHRWAGTARGYSVVLDRGPATVPPEAISTSVPRVQFHGVAPGRWHFHVRACDDEGRWGPAAHRAIEIAGDGR